MPKGIYKRIKKPWNKGLTKETNESLMKVSTGQIGEKNHNFEKKTLKKVKDKMSLTHFKNGTGKWNKGKKRTDEQKEKIRKRNKGKLNPMYGSCRLGEDNPNWKGGITSEDQKQRNSIENRLWREAVFARDNFTCQKCEQLGRELNAHHIKNFAQCRELRTSIENGITFCEKCHKKFHRMFGIRNNNKKQLNKFLNL